MIETGVLSIFPPFIAIALAMITKEVYFSLFIGLASGMAIYTVFSGEHFIACITHIFDMMCSKIADNAYMIVFLALLWAVVVLISQSGGSEAYGKWAYSKLKTKRGTCIATAILGFLVFIDDGFNCLTVGTVMRPVFDRFHISREKLAYIVDSTAAPICIISPISSWSVAIASEINAENGFSTFLSTIPYNLYAILTIVMVVFICVTGKDFGPMKKAEEAESESISEKPVHANRQKKGQIVDLLLPVAVLIICAVSGMAYVGGFFSGVSFSAAIGINPTAGLTLGAFAALVCAMILYLPRKIMKPKEFSGAIVNGIGSIIPPMLILILSWSLGGVCREMIGTGQFISGFITKTNLPLDFLPLVLFVVAALMSFAMGSSWGTFGLLIPIVTMICGTSKTDSLLISVLGATLAGSVYGDHCSPISDTTVLSATGSGSVHIRHVETQLPYSTLVAIICAIGYLMIGFHMNIWISVGICIVILIGLLQILNKTSA